VANPNPEHLFEQAERLIRPAYTRTPRQVDLRRAVSSAYYGVFHATLSAAADEFVGVTRRTTSRYALIYRSVEHKDLRHLCLEMARAVPSPRYTRHAPPAGFGDDIRAFAKALLELQEKRYAADYDPAVRLRTADAILAVETAREALERFRRASPARRKAFLTLLLFQPR
jgi:hypothetical protein